MDYQTTFVPDKVGAFIGVPADTYHAAPGYSRSMLDILSRSPQDFHLIETGAIKKAVTSAMQYGQLFHSAVVDMDNPDKLVHVHPTTYGPDNKKWNGNANECKEWFARHNDKPVLGPDEYAQFLLETAYVKSHPKFNAIALGSMKEVSLFARNDKYGYLTKGRVDLLRYCGGDTWIITDLKTTRDASRRAFSAEILKRRYHVQAAQYRRLLVSLVPNAKVLYALAAIEKGRFMKVNVHYLSNQAIDLGETVVDANMDLLRSCRIQNYWPEWPEMAGLDLDKRDTQIDFIDLPDYVYQDKDILSGMTTATTDDEE